MSRKPFHVQRDLFANSMPPSRQAAEDEARAVATRASLVRRATAPKRSGRSGSAALVKSLKERRAWS